MAYVEDKTVRSKKEGGEWGIKNVEDKFQGLIKEALSCYISDGKMVLNDSLALEYCKYMKNRIGL